MPVWALGAMAATAAFSSEDPLAPVERGDWYHRTMTLDAATAAGWGASAAWELAGHALAVDLYGYHPVWCACGGPARVRGGLLAHSSLLACHFDNLGSTAEIAEAWRRVLGGTEVGVAWAARRDDVSAARHVIGVGLHAVQDFYSHSTWIDEPSRRACTWLEPGPGELPANLSTGGFGPAAGDVPHRHGDVGLSLAGASRLPTMLLAPLLDRAALPLRRRSGTGNPHNETLVTLEEATAGPTRPRGFRAVGTGINLDSRWQSSAGVRERGLPDLTGDQAFTLAAGLAIRESRTWLTRLERRFDADPDTADFWRRVREGPGVDWTIAFNDPLTRAYDFIAAGTYPPARGGPPDSASWFYRVLVTEIHPRTGHFTGAFDRAAATRGFALSSRWPFIRVPKPLARLRWLDSGGRASHDVPVPLGRAVTTGRAPDGAAHLEIAIPGPAHVEVHGFRRADRPDLRVLAYRDQARSGPLRLPLVGTGE